MINLTRMIFNASRRLISFGARWLRRLIFLMLWLPLLYSSTIPVGSTQAQIARMVSPYSFDFITWEIRALSAKAGQTLWGTHPFMSEADRSAFVRTYFDDVARAQSLDSQITVIYGDPGVSDPAAASAALRAERDMLREALAQRQLTTEAILEGQVAAVLTGEGFGLLGQLLPPISMHFTRVPSALIVSPREAILYDYSFALVPLTADESTELEAQIDIAYDVSSLVVPLGGIALYPAMILETSDLRWAIETYAHEWSHHYLLAFPLGLNYDMTPETRIINETTADLFGKEIAPRVLARYYPDLAVTGSVVRTAAQPTPFDFAAEMHETRVTVDRLLAEGRVTEAEQYMEARRQFFHDHGYLIRKLNQAYFAFYGGYQGTASGAAGEDPIGPAVREILAMSPSLHDFIITMRTITNRDTLLDTRDRMRAFSGA